MRVATVELSDGRYYEMFNVMAELGWINFFELVLVHVCGWRRRVVYALPRGAYVIWSAESRAKLREELHEALATAGFVPVEVVVSE